MYTCIIGTSKILHSSKCTVLFLPSDKLHVFICSHFENDAINLTTKNYNYISQIWNRATEFTHIVTITLREWYLWYISYRMACCWVWLICQNVGLLFILLTSEKQVIQILMYILVRKNFLSCPANHSYYWGFPFSEALNWKETFIPKWREKPDASVFKMPHFSHISF